MTSEPRSRLHTWLDRGTTLLVLFAVWGFLLYYFKPSLLMLDTMDAGGDTPSFMRPMHHLKDVLLPAGNPLGWDLGNFAGYAPYQFYFLPPALSIVLLSYAIPFNVAFKLVSVSGVFLLPLAMLLSLRAMRFPFPVPAIGAAASLLFLFNEGNSMWGGNIPSTLAGEFAHSIGFGLSVLFIGYLYKGVEEQKGWRGLGVLLAITGLYHPVAFLNAATGGIFFVLNRREFARNLRFLLLVYATALLVMGFWFVPLVAKIGFATSINWTWHFPSLWDLMPRILWPPAILALCDVVWIAIFRRPENRPARYVLTTMAVTAVFFFNATEVGLPEIRFVPFAYVLMIFLALDFVRRVLPLHIAPHVAAIALSLSLIAWVHKQTTFIPSWIKWNYEGVERKPSYPLLKAITAAVQGTIADPRVAYENSPKHDRFGSMRIFENMALLSGRPTLEGVLLQTAVNSPYIYWLQSQISKQGTGVIPGYPYPSLDLNRATPRLALYNAHDMIAITDEVTKALEGDPRWERTFQQQGYNVFHLKDADPHYVRVPKFRPVRLVTSRWKKDFHRWFSTDASLDVPVVAADTIPAEELDRFPLESTSPTKLPHEPIDATCQIDEKIDHLKMEFTTTCPGQPHVVSVAYFPNWRVEGASRVYLVSPAFMLVFPDGNHVTLTYRRIGSDWLGIAFTIIGLAIVAIGRRRQPLGEPQGALARGLHAVHPALVVAGVVFVVGTTGWHVLRDFGPQYYYKRGWERFTKQDYTASLKDFDMAMWLGGDTNQAADAAFFRAASMFRLDQFDNALAAYQHVVDKFPDSIWVAESHYHIGLCLRRLGKRDEAMAKFRAVIDTYPGNRWAGFSQEQLDQMEKEAAPAAAPAPPADRRPMAFPIEPPVEPMLSKAAAALPPGDGWLFEPKWDGFRALVFRDGDRIFTQSRDAKPLDRYFPELADVFRAGLPERCVVDGEIVIATPAGLDFDLLQMRLHPAASRVQKLAAETPSSFVAFDLLADADGDQRARPQAERRARLERAVSDAHRLHLTPCTRDRTLADEWFHRFEGAGLDGVIAKHESTPYQPGKRAMVKVKHVRTADCVVAGFRWHKHGPGTLVGSLLLGLYDGAGTLHHVGVTSSFTMAARRALAEALEPYRRDAIAAHPWRAWAMAQDASVRMPGGQSRWSAGKDLSWEPLRVERVCEVAYDHLQGNRFRHAATFKRWRPDKAPADCRYDQLDVTPPAELAGIFR